MNFDFSEDIKTMREEANRFLKARMPAGALRQRIESGDTFDRKLWTELAEMGWLGVSIPEEFGGSELGYEALCMLAEEIGLALPSVPFGTTIYCAAEALLLFGSTEQKKTYLPKIATGELVGTFALAEGPGDPGPHTIRTLVRDGKLTGTKIPVVDGDIADFAIVAARSEKNETGLYIVDLHGSGITRTELKTLDATRAHIRLEMDNATAELLAGATEWSSIACLLDRIAILYAFEQVGGAQAALDMAVSFATDRFAFGRPIASFQAIKHKLADVYVATELARSNAYYGAWAIDNSAEELSIAAAAARVASIEAFHLASRENIQTHGGMGITWEADCHFYYRRAKQLAGTIGSQYYWRNRLIDQLLDTKEN